MSPKDEHSKKALQESDWESSLERVPSIQRMWSAGRNKQSPYLGRLLACVYTSHAELSLVVLTALWKENPPEIK